MKKTNIGAAVIGGALLVSLLGTGIWAYYHSVQDSKTYGLAQTTTLKVDTDFEMTDYCEDLYPSSIFLIGKGRVMNRGTKDVLVKIAPLDPYAIMWRDPSTHEDYDASTMGNDYAYDSAKGGWVFSEDRMNDCFTLDFKATVDNPTEFVGDSTLPDTYYFLLKAGETKDLGEIRVLGRGEIGGSVIPRDPITGVATGPMSASRLFENGNVHYYTKIEVASVQNTKSAVMDIFSEDACAQIKAHHPDWILDDYSNR